MRRITTDGVITVVATVMSLFFIYLTLFGGVESFSKRVVFLLFTTVLVFLRFPSGRDVHGNRVATAWDVGLIVVSVVALGYLLIRYEYILTRFPFVDPLSTQEMILGVVTILIVLEISRRVLGWVLPLVAGVFIAYVFSGPVMPGILRHAGFSLEMFVDMSYMTMDGIMGQALNATVSFVILFVIFGAFLSRSGAADFFMRFAIAAVGWSRGGPAKVAILASALFGSISGSATANVAVTGSVTIPMMKDAGFRPEDAAGVEAVASTGGQILPPIMGAAAFVMAEFLGVGFETVIKLALIPAVLYFVAVFLIVHLEARRKGMVGLSRAEMPRLLPLIRSKGYLAFPLITIVVLLLLGFTATYASVIASATVVVVTAFRKETRMSLMDIIKSLAEGAVDTLPIAAATACAGLIIGSVSLTGLGLRMTSYIVDLSGQSVFLALVLTMVGSVILGMGMPTTPAYIIQAALVIPAVIRLGILPQAAHMFVLYFAAFSSITPPVALASYTAAGIAETDIVKASIAGLKYGIASFIVPFMFAFGPPLLGLGTGLEVVIAVLTGLLGVVALAAAVQGWLFGRASWIERIIMVVAALTLIHPGASTDWIGLPLFGVVVFMNYVRNRTRVVRGLAN